MLGLNALAGALLVPLGNLVTTGSQLQLLGSYIERHGRRVGHPARAGCRPSPAVQVNLKGGIELERVSFRYAPTSPLVVQDVSVSIEPGQSWRSWAAPGAGKTTLANLLLGLYLPTSGRVLYDGVDLTELDLHSVRGQMGVVPAGAGLLRHHAARQHRHHRSRRAPLEPVIEAARLAQIHDDMLAMPMGYDTLLVDRGASLSGASASGWPWPGRWCSKPAVLLLDEATSALDAITEARVQRALASLQCTRIVIAHRLSTVVDADLILVMDGGRLVESRQARGAARCAAASTRSWCGSSSERWSRSPELPGPSLSLGLHAM